MHLPVPSTDDFLAVDRRRRMGHDPTGTRRVKDRIAGGDCRSLHIDLVSDRTEAANKWRDLEHRMGNIGLTNGWPWVNTWLDNYVDVVKPTFAFGVTDRRIVGAALIIEATYRIRGISVPALHIGTAGEPTRERTTVEYNRLLVETEHLDPFATNLILALKREFRWSALRLNGFVPVHAEALVRACVHAGLALRTDVKRCPVFDFAKAVDEGFPDVVSAFGSNTRRSIRRSMRLFRDHYGPLGVEWAETEEQATVILHELIALHQDRWQSRGEAGAFPTHRVRRYHEQLIGALSLWPAGSLILLRVRYGETTVGCLYSFVEDGRVMFYKGGLARFVDNRFKPGLVTHAICMAECEKRGLLEAQSARRPERGDSEYGSQRLAKYDFLVGEGRYKEQLSNSESTLIWVLARRGPTMWLLERIRRPAKVVRNFVRMVRSRERLA
jgi:hypothetical protein